jgi:hypothetical protein
MWLEETTESDCVSEVQMRELDSDVGEWMDWVGENQFTSPQCTQLEKRMRWLLPTASTGSCIGEQQNRTRIDNGDWELWDGALSYETCEQTGTRVRYKDAVGFPCESEEQTRRRVGYGDWTRWSGTYENADCVQPGAQIEEQIRYLDDGSCTMETQTRTRVNGGPWSDWMCNAVETNAAAGSWKGDPCIGTLEACLETQKKFKYVSVDQMCVFSESTRFREQSGDMLDAWSPWSGFAPTVVEVLST